MAKKATITSLKSEILDLKHIVESYKGQLTYAHDNYGNVSKELQKVQKEKDVLNEEVQCLKNERTRLLMTSNYLTKAIEAALPIADPTMVDRPESRNFLPPFAYRGGSW